SFAEPEFRDHVEVAAEGKLAVEEDIPAVGATLLLGDFGEGHACLGMPCRARNSAGVNASTPSDLKCFTFRVITWVAFTRRAALACIESSKSFLVELTAASMSSSSSGTV